MPLLHIYDRDDKVIGLTVKSRGDTTLPVPDVAGLILALNDLLAKSARFDRILFETHGSPGRIYRATKPFSH